MAHLDLVGVWVYPLLGGEALQLLHLILLLPHGGCGQDEGQRGAPLQPAALLIPPGAGRVHQLALVRQ